MRRTRFGVTLFATVLGAVIAMPAYANSIVQNFLEQSTEPVKQSIELNNGFSATQNSWSSYVSGIWAPFASINRPGFRVKLLGGYGQYTYHGTQTVNASTLPIFYQGQTSLAEGMIGYSFDLDPLYLKLYAGAVWEEHKISPEDPQNQAQGKKIDIKGQAELWLKLGEDGWTSVDVSYSAASQSYGLYSKIGYKLLTSLSLGPALGALGNAEYDAIQIGAFLRINSDYGDLTLSGGMSGDYEEAGSRFGTINFSSKF